MPDEPMLEPFERELLKQQDTPVAEAPVEETKEKPKTKAEPKAASKAKKK